MKGLCRPAEARPRWIVIARPAEQVEATSNWTGNGLAGRVGWTTNRALQESTSLDVES